MVLYLLQNKGWLAGGIVQVPDRILHLLAAETYGIEYWIQMDQFKSASIEYELLHTTDYMIHS
jgi:hypothetical protein